MEERRRLQRTKVLRNARIILNRSPMISCTLHNLTSEGACLSVANTCRLPDSFELTFERGRTRRLCRVIWRTQTRLGVCFAAPGADMAPIA
jgi:hypothetical protein